jgi:hypothetical protein
MLHMDMRLVLKALSLTKGDRDSAHKRAHCATMQGDKLHVACSCDSCQQCDGIPAAA